MCNCIQHKLLYTGQPKCKGAEENLRDVYSAREDQRPVACVVGGGVETQLVPSSAHKQVCD